MLELSRSLNGLFRPNLTTVVLVRHAESLANLAGAIAGWTDVRLTEYGRKQAASLYEGLHPHLPRFKQIYSSDAKKAGYNDMNYVAPGGEGWLMVRRRSQQFFSENLKESGVYLCYTHGGLMCTLTYDLGIKDVLPNCSIVALSLKEADLVFWSVQRSSVSDSKCELQCL
jgi:broad specificity phosphatase PhoE